MQSENNQFNRVNANGRSLKSGPIEGPPIIQDWMVDGKLRFACVVAEPEHAPSSVRRLIVRLRQRQREVHETARRLFGVPALLAHVDEQKLLAQRRRLLGTPALRDDRTSRRLIAGDSRQALQAAGAV